MKRTICRTLHPGAVVPAKVCGRKRFTRLCTNNGSVCLYVCGGIPFIAKPENSEASLVHSAGNFVGAVECFSSAHYG